MRTLALVFMIGCAGNAEVATTTARLDEQGREYPGTTDREVPPEEQPPEQPPYAEEEPRQDPVEDIHLFPQEVKVLLVMGFSDAGWEKYPLAGMNATVATLAQTMIVNTAREALEDLIRYPLANNKSVSALAVTIIAADVNDGDFLAQGTKKYAAQVAPGKQYTVSVLPSSVSTISKVMALNTFQVIQIYGHGERDLASININDISRDFLKPAALRTQQRPHYLMLYSCFQGAAAQLGAWSKVIAAKRTTAWTYNPAIDKFLPYQQTWAWGAAGAINPN